MHGFTSDEDGFHVRLVSHQRIKSENRCYHLSLLLLHGKSEQPLERRKDFLALDVLHIINLLKVG